MSGARTTGRAVSPGEPHVNGLTFVVGCPRSGTTWMQLLLAEHPRVATANETFLFYRYLDALWREWEAEEDRYARPVGLRHLLDEDRFLELCSGFARDVLSEISTPDSPIVVEKTPGHVTTARLILACFPDARFLHVVRDPRDVVCSLLAAGASWASGWAPRNAHDAAHLWRSLVSEGRGIADMTDRYREVRYEDLQADTAGELAGVLSWMGLSHSARTCREAARATSLDAVSSGRQRDDEATGSRPWDTDREPAGFFRRGQSGYWEEDLTPLQLHTVEYVTQDVMAHFGYPTTSPLLGMPPVGEIRRTASRTARRVLSTLLPG